MENKVIKGHDAEALKNNALLREVFKTVREYLDDKSLSCNPDDPRMTQRVVLARQIFASIERGIERIIQDGKLEEFRIQELEKRRKVAIFKR